MATQEQDLEHHLILEDIITLEAELELLTEPPEIIDTRRRLAKQYIMVKNLDAAESQYLTLITSDTKRRQEYENALNEIRIGQQAHFVLNFVKNTEIYEKYRNDNNKTFL